MPRFDKEYQEYLRGECKNYDQPLINALEEEERGGETMLRYGDDQCKECGGIRVANSTLCASCLVRRLDAEMAENLIKRSVIEALKLELAKMNTRLCGAVDYGFKKNQENAKLHRYIGELEAQIASEWEADLW